MGDKKIYVIAKIFNKQGCIAYNCKTPYTFIDDMKVYIDKVAELEAIS